jgi:hypothetical protein
MFFVEGCVRTGTTAPLQGCQITGAKVGRRCIAMQTLYKLTFIFLVFKARSPERGRRR